MIDREAMTEAYLSQGVECAAIIEDVLGVNGASLVHPRDIAASSYAVFALGDDDKIYHGDPIVAARDSLSVSMDPNFSSDLHKTTLQLRGYSPDQVINRYADLIGQKDYREGEIAKSLNKSSPQLQQALGEMYAYFVMANPQFTPPTTIDFLPSQKTLIYPPGENQLIGLIYELAQKPKIVVDYGAGLGKIGRMEEELAAIDQTILIDKGEFIGAALTVAASEHELDEPKVVVHSNGIKSATQQLRSEGFEGQVDLITMAMVHAAGKIENDAAIKNGYALLRPGGALAIQVVSPVLEGQADGVEVYRKIVSQFGNPMSAQKYSYRHPLLGQHRFGLQAVFLK